MRVAEPAIGLMKKTLDVRYKLAKRTASVMKITVRSDPDLVYGVLGRDPLPLTCGFTFEL